MFVEDFKLIRGARIQQQLAVFEDSTFSKLEQNIDSGFPTTKKRQHATLPIQIKDIKYVPYQAGLKVQAVSTNAENGNVYEPIILFQNIDLTNNPTGVAVMMADGREHKMNPIPLSTTVTKVRCSCLDFYHRFSTFNFSDNSLEGNPMPQYVPKGTGRGPVNPYIS